MIEKCDSCIYSIEANQKYHFCKNTINIIISDALIN